MIQQYSSQKQIIISNVMLSTHA